jgi:sulfite exporter TauE/SafE
MLSSIHPLGERGKGNRFAVTAAAFVAGTVVGGATVGAMLGALGMVVGLVVPDAAALAVVGALAVAAAVFERSGRRLPSVPRQVDENWLNEYRGWVYGSGFGFQLGAGVLTYITSAAVYVALAAALLAGHPLAAVAIMASFGLTRGLSLLPARRIQTPAQLVSFHRRLQRSAGAVRLASTSVLTCTALAAGVVLIQELP